MLKEMLMMITCVLIISTGYGQSNCKVKLETLDGTYTGECKKGIANGKGIAKGDHDIYEGEFKKGLPHGEGTYTWGNGEIYAGEFSKGKMDGKGVLTIKKDGEVSVLTGFFDKGEYIGKYEYPYRVSSKKEVKNVNLQEIKNGLTGDLNYEIKIKIKQNGNYIAPVLTIDDENRTVALRRGNEYVLTNVRFPVKKIEVSFTHAGFSSRVVVDIYKKGNWTIEITI